MVYVLYSLDCEQEEKTVILAPLLSSQHSNHPNIRKYHKNFIDYIARLPLKWLCIVYVTQSRFHYHLDYLFDNYIDLIWSNGYEIVRYYNWLSTNEYTLLFQFSMRDTTLHFLLKQLALFVHVCVCVFFFFFLLLYRLCIKRYHSGLMTYSSSIKLN